MPLLLHRQIGPNLRWLPRWYVVPGTGLLDSAHATPTRIVRVLAARDRNGKWLLRLPDREYGPREFYDELDGYHAHRWLYENELGAWGHVLTLQGAEVDRLRAQLAHAEREREDVERMVKLKAWQARQAQEGEG